METQSPATIGSHHFFPLSHFLCSSIPPPLYPFPYIHLLLGTHIPIILLLFLFWPELRLCRDSSFLRIFFLMWTIFKVFVELVTVLLLSYVMAL